MIKKFTNWYNNLLSFKKVRLWQIILCVISYLLGLILGSIVYKQIDFVIYSLFLCPWFPLVTWVIISLIFNPDNMETQHELRTMYKEQESQIEVWFNTVSSNCIKVDIKINNLTGEILSYYHNKHLLVESFYVEKSVLNSKTVYYILADCQGKKDRVLFPKVIKNPGYILARFTLAKQ